MEDLSKDVLFSFALELDLPDLLRFCNSHPKINGKVCQKNDIWIRKLFAEYPLLNITGINNPKGLYMWLKEKVPYSQSFKKVGKKYVLEKSIVKKGEKYYIMTEQNRPLDLEKSEKMEINTSYITQVAEILQFPNVSPDFLGRPELKVSLYGHKGIKYSMFVISKQKVEEIYKNMTDDQSFLTGPYGEIYPVSFTPEKFKGKYKKLLEEQLGKKMNGRFYNGGILIYLA